MVTERFSRYKLVQMSYYKKIFISVMVVISCCFQNRLMIIFILYKWLATVISEGHVRERI